MAEAAHFPVVGIGASAGGLEAITSFMHALPSETGMAFVLIQHLEPSHPSSLSELIARTTKMTVAPAENGMAVQPDHVYVIPPNRNLAISENKLQLSAREKRSGPHMPVDHFLRSLAADRGNAAIGVVLSGTGSDGTFGLAAVKAEGGITFAQDPSARFDGMPQSAIAAGHVDFVMPPEEIARELLRISQHAYLARPEPEKAAEEDPALERIFLALRNFRGVDFAQYRRTTIARRVVRRMAVHQIDSVADYATMVSRNAAETEALYQDLLINVTRFFRDPEAFEYLKAEVYPRIMEARQNGESVRIWAAGCSSGEETYSLAITLLEFLGEQAVSIPIQIFGTDIFDGGIERARRGVYPENIQADVSPERLRRYFTHEAGGYRIAKPIREMCIFARQNLFNDPPFSQLDLISCRNVLIYNSPPLQKRVIPLLHYALKPDRYLFLGSSEGLANLGPLFQVLDKKHRVFIRRPAAHRVPVDIGRRAAPPIAPREPATSARSTESALEVQREFERALLARFAPAAILVNEDGEIVQSHGDAGTFLRFPTGKPSMNILRVVREGLLFDVRNALNEARETNKTAVRRNVGFKVHRESRQANVEISPIGGKANRRYMVIFEAAAGAAPEAKATKGKGKGKPAKTAKAATKAESAREMRIIELEKEISATREYLSSLLENQDGVNEELQSANEEILSSNEELQSTNEELETAKEELQSTNEELTTVNEELRNRNAELTESNNDLLNVLNHVRMSIILLDKDLNIRRWTPLAERALGLMQGDAGRGIATVRLRIDLPDLEPIAKKVMETEQSIEREIHDERESAWYLVRVLAYRTSENKVDGVVLTWTDITAIKRGEERLAGANAELETRVRERTESLERTYASLQAREAQLRALIGQVRGIVLTTDRQFRITLVEGTSLPLLKLAGEALIGKHVSTLLGSGDRTLETFTRALQGQAGFYEVELKSRIFRGYVEPLNDREGRFAGTVGFLLDLTERKALEEQLRNAQKMESLGRLASGIAHDFNNLLSIIQGNTESLREVLPRDAPTKQALDDIEGATQHVAALTRQLLAFGKSQVLALQLLDLNDVIRDTEKLLRRLLPPSIELKPHLSPHPVTIKADKAQMQQILINLLLNARDAMPDGGRIEVETTTIDGPRASSEDGKPARRALLAIGDSGVGISTEDREHIFEPFYTTKSSGRGSGLGLSTVHGIVSQLGGEIELQSEPGKGTRFEIYLPAVDGSDTTARN